MSVAHLAVSPDGLRFAAAAGSSVRLFTLPPGQPGAAPEVEKYPPLPSTVESLRMDAGGNLLASYYGGVTLWDLRQSKEEKQGLDLPYDVSPGSALLPSREAACSSRQRAAALPCFPAARPAGCAAALVGVTFISLFCPLS